MSVELAGVSTPPQVYFSYVLNYGCCRLVVFEVFSWLLLWRSLSFLFLTLCHHCNYDACSGCMQWQHGDVGDHPPSKNAIHSASSIFRVIRTRRKVFLLISTPPLGPSSLIRHSKAVFKKSGASLSYGNSRCSCRRFFWSTRFFWYCCEAASVGRRRYFCSTTINHCGIA